MSSALDRVHAVILAAGASRRFGRPKQLLAWRGKMLLQSAVDTTRALLDARVTVVLGAHHDEILSAVDFGGVQVVVNEAWPEGVAASIRAGIAALPKDAEAALLMLGDQPLIGALALQKLLDTWQNEPQCIAAAFYFETVGVPAVFPSAFFDELTILQGDRGAKRLLLKYEANLLKTPLPEAELDIDTKDDFEQLTGISVPGSE
ncbi:MAG: nucleotidyltransferase family protein [Methylomicrobium sp.]